METKDIIKEIKQLPLNQKKLVLNETFKSIQSDEKETKLDKAVQTLMKDYHENSELTDLTALDFEEFYETK